MKGLKILFFLLFVAPTAQAQTLFDTKRLKLIDSLIELEIPTEQLKWLEGRKRIEDYEIEFCKDTFRIRQMRCMLINSMSEMENESSLKKLAFIYETEASRFDKLVDKYVILLEQKYPKKQKETLLASQKHWQSYRKSVLQLFDETYNGYDVSLNKNQQHVKINELRLIELYELYIEIAH